MLIIYVGRKRIMRIMSCFLQILKKQMSVCDIKIKVPHLQALDAAQHVQVSCRVLLYDVFHVIWTQHLLKLPLRH